MSTFRITPVTAVSLLIVLLFSITVSEKSRNYTPVLSIKATSSNDFFSPRNVTPFHGCQTGLLPPSATTVPEYEIDLDSPPKKRWVVLVKDKKSEIVALIESVKANSNALFGRSLFWMVDKFLPHLAQTLPKQYLQEMQGISESLNLNLGEVTLLNLFYEFFSVCTSIIAKSNNGTLYHGRNLDFGLFLGWDPINHTWQTTEMLRPLVVKLNFHRNSEHLYSSINYAGYIGTLTAMKKKTFSLTIDERFRVNGGYVGLAEWILGMRDQQWIGFLSREVMESCDSYVCAQKKLSLSPLVAPVYFIITGNQSHEGCIITRDRKNFDIWSLGQKHDNQKGDWFLVQTNYDHWMKPPFYDDRRTPALVCMDQLGQDDILSTLCNVLSTQPVLNQLTTYTTIMSTNTDVMLTWLQNCNGTCWPW